MTKLQHDTAIGTMRAVFDQLKADLAPGRRLSAMYLIYYSFKAGLEKYEELVERRLKRLQGIPSDN